MAIPARIVACSGTVDEPAMRRTALRASPSHGEASSAALALLAAMRLIAQVARSAALRRSRWKIMVARFSGRNFSRATEFIVSRRVIRTGGGTYTKRWNIHEKDIHLTVRRLESWHKRCMR